MLWRRTCPTSHATVATSQSVAWLDRLLDGLEIETTTLVGHSGGGVLAIRYALARPDRVDRLVVIGVPTLPGTRCPLPHRLMATPGVGRLLAKMPASRASALRFAEVMGEGTTLAGHPDLVDLFVVAHREPATAAALRSDLRELISPAALLTRSGWGRGRLRVEDLRAVDMPTLLVWGQKEPLGEASVAQAAAELFPRALPEGAARRTRAVAGTRGPHRHGRFGVRPRAGRLATTRRETCAQTTAPALGSGPYWLSARCPSWA